MRVIRSDRGHIQIMVERNDTLEEMASMAALTMDDLADEINKIINRSILESKSKKEEH